MIDKKSRVLVLGLDSATFVLLKPWIAEGKLPVLSDLIACGVSGQLRSTLPPHTAPAWSTFMTGKNPGNHGVFGFMKLTEQREGIRLVSSIDRKAQDLWEILSKHGKRVVVIRVPLTYPTRPVNGILMSGFMTPPSASDYVYPPSMKEELESEIGMLSAEAPNSPVKTDLEAAILNDLNFSLHKFGEGLPELIRKHEWDFFMVVFQGTDEVQHRFWHLQDRNHPLYDEKRASKYGDAIQRYYQRVDKIIGLMLEKIDRSNTTIIVLSDHGAGPLHKWVSLNNLFWRKGLLVFKSNLYTQLKLLCYRIGLTPIRLYRAVWKLHLTGVRNLVRKEETRSNLRTLFLSLTDVDWTRTRAYALGGWGQIYVNREALRAVSYEEVRDEVTRSLLALKDEENLKPVFLSENIFRREEIYKGRYLKHAPDIIALPESPYQGYPDYEFGFNGVFSDAVGISGTHTIDGMIVISGPNIKRGITLPNHSIIDVAPTIMNLMGLPCPDDFDGSIISEALISHSLTANLPAVSNAADEITSTNPYTNEEEERLMRKLRDLGYL